MCLASFLYDAVNNKFKRMNKWSFLVLCTGICSCQQLEAQPNVLIILVDDAGYTSFGFNGAKVITPYIDSLASQGVICTDAHTMGSVSAPSRAMLMTGRYGQRFGFECNLDIDGAGLPKEEETLGDIFKRNGYATAAIGKWHLGYTTDMHPNKQGFEYFFGFLAGSRSYYYRPNADDKDGNLQQMQCNGKAIKFDGYLTDVLTDNALSYIESTGDKPFMMYLAYNAIHTPLEAPKEDLQKFQGNPRQYILAMTSVLDRNIGKLINGLQRSGKLDNTLIFFLADNGGAINNLESNLPFKGFKGNKFEGGHRVPFFVVWGNKLQKNIRYDGLVSSLDIMATAIDAAKIPIRSLKNEIDGQNLIPYLNGKKKGSPHKFLFWRKMNDSAVRTPEYKLITVEGYGSVLYNLKTDPGEKYDIKNKEPKVFKKLVSEWEKWNSEMIGRKWDDGGLWPQVTDTITIDLMNNLSNEELILYPGAKRVVKQKN